MEQVELEEVLNEIIDILRKQNKQISRLKRELRKRAKMDKSVMKVLEEQK